MQKRLAVFLTVCILNLSLSPIVIGESFFYPTAFERALIYFSVGRWDKVTDELNNALRETPDDPELLTFIGGFLSALGDESQATTFLSRAERNSPSIGVYVIQGDVYRRLKNIRKAEEYYNKALKQEPNTVMAYIGLGRLKEIDNKLEDALELYLRALEINPQRIETLISSGKVEYSLERYEEAATHFAKAVELDSSVAEHHLWYAKSLYGSGLSDKALKQLERTLELDSTLSEAEILKSQWLSEYIE